MTSNSEAHREAKDDAVMYDGPLSHLTQFTQVDVEKMQRLTGKARALPLSEAADIVLECSIDAGRIEGEVGASSHLLAMIDGRGAGSQEYRCEKLRECVEVSICTAYENGMIDD